jgi:hypothetical protein
VAEQVAAVIQVVVEAVVDVVAVLALGVLVAQTTVAQQLRA